MSTYLKNVLLVLVTIASAIYATSVEGKPIVNNACSYAHDVAYHSQGTVNWRFWNHYCENYC